MTFYKLLEDAYIIGVQTSSSEKGGNIDGSEYNAILEKIKSTPTAPAGYQYRLRADTLEWELMELPSVETDEELTAEEIALAIQEAMA